MVSCRVISIGVCLFSSIAVPAHADVDQLRMASTGPFTFIITPASPLPAVPQQPVNRAPLDASPAASAAVAAEPQVGDEATKAAEQHDEDVATAGLHVSPRQLKETDEPADHPSLSEMTHANAVPSEPFRAYTPIPREIGTLFNALDKTKDGRGGSAEPNGMDQPVASATAPVVLKVPPPDRTAAVPSPAVSAAPPQYVPVAPCCPPQVIIGGASDIRMATRTPAQDYRQGSWRRDALQQQRLPQMANSPSPIDRSGPRVRPLAGYRLAYYRPVVHSMRIGGHR